jgi:hypothetical protein
MITSRESLPGSADFRDGLHLSGKGHELLFEEVERVIKADFSEFDPENMEASEVKWPSPLVLPG